MTIEAELEHQDKGKQTLDTQFIRLERQLQRLETNALCKRLQQN